MNRGSDNRQVQARTRWPRWVGYPITVLVEAVLTAGLLALDPHFPLGRYPIPYVVALMAVAYWLGGGPAILAFVLGLLAFDYFFIPPLHAILPRPAGVQGWAQFTAFFLGTAVVGFAMVLIRRSQRRNQRLAQELRESNEHVTGILESITDAFFALDREWRFTFANAEAERLLQKTRDELMGEVIWDLFPEAVGSTFYNEYHRAMAEQVTAEFEEYYPPLGAWFAVRAYPSASGLSVYFRDVSERKRAQDRQELTTRILWRLNQQAEFPDTVREILKLVKEFAGVEAAAIRLREGDDFPFFVAEGFTEKFLRDERYLLARDERGRVLCDKEGCPMLECVCGGVAVGRTDPARPFFTQGGSFWTNSASELAATTPEEVLGRIRGRCIKEGYQFIALVPLQMDQTILGILQLADKRTGWFSLDQIEYLEEIGASIGIALARKQAEEELRQSRQTLERHLSLLQQALVPPQLPTNSGYGAAAVYLPAFLGEQIGGDFYDLFKTERGQIGIVVGDVAGKGIEAAALAAAARSTIRSFAHELVCPGNVMSHANAVLQSQESESGIFVTVFLVIIDPLTGSMSYARAGHPPAAIWRPDGEVKFLEAGSLPICVAAGQEYETLVDCLDPGDKVVLYTDGITEARRGTELFGLEGVRSALITHGHGNPDEVARGLLAAAREWAEGRLQDDVAVLVVERSASESA